MSYAVQVDLDEPAEFASIRGLAEFRAWVEGLDAPALRHLTEYGWSQEVPRMIAELRKHGGSASTEVSSSIVALLTALRADATVASITDGLGE